MSYEYTMNSYNRNFVVISSCSHRKAPETFKFDIDGDLLKSISDGDFPFRRSL